MKEKLKSIIDYYGIGTQIGQTMEECAELIVALNKYLRVKGSLLEYKAIDIAEEIAITEEITNIQVKAVFDIAEEIADVQVMLEQLKIHFDIEKMTAEIIEKKINRTLERMEKESETIAEKTGGHYE